MYLFYKSLNRSSQIWNKAPILVLKRPAQRLEDGRRFHDLHLQPVLQLEGLEAHQETHGDGADGHQQAESDGEPREPALHRGRRLLFYHGATGCFHVAIQLQSPPCERKTTVAGFAFWTESCNQTVTGADQEALQTPSKLLSLQVELKVSGRAQLGVNDADSKLCFLHRSDSLVTQSTNRSRCLPCWSWV